MTVENENVENEAAEPKYAISETAAEELGRSLPLLAYSRQSWMRKQEMELEEAITAGDFGEFMANIADHCSQQPDYLPPDTPMQEAIFRYLLARRNEPATAAEISAELSDKWSATQFQRDTSPRVIRRLLDSARDYYCIERVAE